MAISNNYVPIRQIGNGVTTEFSSNWSVLSSDYLVVAFEDATTGVQTIQTTGFTLDFDSSGFTVAFSVAPSSSNYVVIGRSVTINQSVPYRTSKGFEGDRTEASFDKVTAICQDLSDSLDRSLKFQLGSSADGILPEPVDDMLIAWDGVTGLMKNVASAAVIIAASSAAVASASAAASSASSASSSASTATSAAATAVTNAAIVSAAAGAIVTITNQWNYSNSTSMADPGTGAFRLNNVIASATQIAMSCLTGDSGNPNLRAYMATWDDSTTTANRGYLRIFKAASPNVFAIFAITGNLTDNTTWDQLPITYIAGNGSFTNGDAIFIQFNRTGDAGSAGAGTGDFSSNTATSVDGEIMLFSGTLGKTGKRATGSGFAKVTSGVLSAQSTIGLTDLAAQAARSVVLNATNASAAPTAVQLAAAQLLGCNAGGTAAGAITLGTNVSMTGTTLNVASALPAGVTGSISGTTSITVDFTTYSAYLLEVDGLTISTSAAGYIDASSDGGSNYGTNISTLQIGTTVTSGQALYGNSASRVNHAVILHQQSTSGHVTGYGVVNSTAGPQLVGTIGLDITLSAACNKIRLSAAQPFTSGTYRLTPLTVR